MKTYFQCKNSFCKKEFSIILEEKANFLDFTKIIKNCPICNFKGEVQIIKSFFKDIKYSYNLSSKSKIACGRHIQEGKGVFLIENKKIKVLSPFEIFVKEKYRNEKIKISYNEKEQIIDLEEQNLAFLRDKFIFFAVQKQTKEIKEIKTLSQSWGANSKGEFPQEFTRPPELTEEEVRIWKEKDKPINKENIDLFIKTINHFPKPLKDRFLVFLSISLISPLNTFLKSFNFFVPHIFVNGEGGLLKTETQRLSCSLWFQSEVMSSDKINSNYRFNRLSMLTGNSIIDEAESIFEKKGKINKIKEMITSDFTSERGNKNRKKIDRYKSRAVLFFNSNYNILYNLKSEDLIALNRRLIFFDFNVIKDKIKDYFSLYPLALARLGGNELGKLAYNFLENIDKEKMKKNLFKIVRIINKYESISQYCIVLSVVYYSLLLLKKFYFKDIKINNIFKNIIEEKIKNNYVNELEILSSYLASLNTFDTNYLFKKGFLFENMTGNIIILSNSKIEIKRQTELEINNLKELEQKLKTIYKDIVYTRKTIRGHTYRCLIVNLEEKKEKNKNINIDKIIKDIEKLKIEV